MNTFEFDEKMNELGRKSFFGLTNSLYGCCPLMPKKMTLEMEKANMDDVKSVRSLTRGLNLCAQSDSIIDKIARDAAERAVKMTEEELFKELIGGKKWHKIESERDLPSPEMYECVLVKCKHIGRPWVAPVKNLVKKSNEPTFMDISRQLYVHYWCEIPEFDID